MNCFPVIERELRAAARRQWTFRLRLLFALTAIVICAVVVVMPRRGVSGPGLNMLYALSYLSMAFCLTTGGLLTADSVSSEKREGTIGLLFLTPLSGLDIILGKMACHGLQLLYGLCAVGPTFFLPILMGGVTGAEVSRVLLALVLILTLAASVGMMISVLGNESKRTLMAVVVSLAFIVVIPLVLVQCLKTLGLAQSMRDILGLLSPVCTLEAAFDSSYKTAAGPKLYWSSAAVLAVVSLSLMGIAGGSLGRVFRAMGSTGIAAPNLPRPASPVVGAVAGNPYEWLVLRGGESSRGLGMVGRLLVILWVGLPTIFVLTRNYIPAFISAFFTALAIHVFYKLRFAIEASHQIQSDRQSGGLELLLVTELAEDSIIKGHQVALRKLSRRPFWLLLGINLALELVMFIFPRTLDVNGSARWLFSACFVGGIVLAAVDLAALRWLALWQGLQGGSHVRAVLVTLGLCLVVPWLLFGLIMGLLMMGRVGPEMVTIAVIVWVAGSMVYEGILAGYCQARLSVGVRRLVSEPAEQRSAWLDVWTATFRAMRRAANPRGWPAIGSIFLAWLARPKTRKALLLFITAVLIVTAFYAEENWRGWQAWQRYRSFQTATHGRIGLNAVHAAAVPSSQNIFEAPRMRHWFLQPGENELTQALDYGSLRAWLRRSQPMLTADRQPSAQEFLSWSSRCQPEFELIRQALRRPIARVETDARELSGRPVLNLLSLRAVEKAVLLQLVYHLELRHAAEARQDLALLHDLGRLSSTGQDGQPESLAMAFSLMQWAEAWTEAISAVLRTRTWSADELAMLQEQLRTTDLFPSMASAVASERNYAWKGLETATPFNLPGVFGPEQPMTRSEKLFSPSVQILALGPRGWVYQNMVFIVREYPVVMAGVDFTNHLVWPGGAARACQEIERLSRGAFPYREIGLALLPNPPEIARQLAQAQTLVNQGQIACALERYRMAEGKYPAELSSLAPRYLASIPPDIMGGRPMKYRLDRQNYTLYSIGWNGVDDGARTNKVAGAPPDDWIWAQSNPLKRLQ